MSEQSLADAYKEWMRKGGSGQNVKLSPNIIPKSKSAAAKEEKAAKEAAKAEKGPAQTPLQWGIDIISRPLYGVANAMTDVIDKGSTSTSALEAFWEGLTSNEAEPKKTGVDVYDAVARKINPDHVTPKGADLTDNGGMWDAGDWASVIRGGAGLAFDIGADPLTYIPVAGPIVKGAKALATASKGAKAGKVAEEVVEDVAEAAATGTKRTAEAPTVPPSLAPAAPVRDIATEAPAAAAARQSLADRLVAGQTAGEALERTPIPASMGRNVVPQRREIPSVLSDAAKQGPIRQIVPDVAENSTLFGSKVATPRSSNIENLSQSFDSELANLRTGASSARGALRQGVKLSDDAKVQVTKEVNSLVDEIEEAYDEAANLGTFIGNKSLDADIPLDRVFGKFEGKPLTVSRFIQIARKSPDAARAMMQRIPEMREWVPEFDQLSSAAVTQRDEALAALSQQSAKGGTAGLPGFRAFLKDAANPKAQTLRDATRGSGTFNSLSRTRDPDTIDRILTELIGLSGKGPKSLDRLTPEMVAGGPALHEVTRNFIKWHLNLRPSDFSRTAEQIIFERTQQASAGNLIPNIRATNAMDDLDPESLKALSDVTRTAPDILRNQSDAVFKAILGDHFDPKNIRVGSGNGEGNVYYRDPKTGERHMVREGEINQFTFTSMFENLRKGAEVEKRALQIAKDRALRIAREKDPNARAPKVSAPLYLDRVQAKRELMSVKTQETTPIILESGIEVGIHIDDAVVPLLPGDIFKAVDDFADAMLDDVGEMARGALARRNGSIAARILYSPNTGVPITNFLEAMGMLASGRGVDDAMAAMLKTESATGKVIPNPLMDGKPHWHGNATGKGKPKDKDGVTYQKATAANGKTYYRAMYSSERLQADARIMLEGLEQSIKQASEEYATGYALKGLNDTSAILKSLEETLIPAMQKGNGAGMAAMATLEDDIARMAAELGSSPLTAEAVAKYLEKTVPVGAPAQAKAAKKTEKAAEKEFAEARAGAKNSQDAGKKFEQAKTKTAEHDSRKNSRVDDTAMIDDIAEEMLGKPRDTFDISDHTAAAEFRAGATLARMFDPLAKKFSIRYGTYAEGKDLWENMRQVGSVVTADIERVKRQILEVHRKYNARVNGTDETVLGLAFKSFQRGEETLSETLTGTQAAMFREATEELRPLMDNFFDIDGNGVTGDLFLRNSQNLKLMEEAVDFYGLKHVVNFDEALIAGDPAAAWRQWDIDNPAEFLQLYNAAAHRALGAKYAGDSLKKTLKDASLLSDGPRPGWVTLEAEQRSYLFASFADGNYYMPREVAEIISELDRKVLASRDLSGKFGDFLSRTFDPIQRTWKTGMTIYRPGHHIRNILSNGALSYIAEGHRNLARSGSIALRLQSRRKGILAPGEDGVLPASSIEMALQGNLRKVKSGDEIAFTVQHRKMKKPMEFTFDGLNMELEKRGLFRTFQQSEDIIQNESNQGFLNKFADIATFKGRLPEKLAGGASEISDHHGIVQQATQIIMNNAHLVGTKKFPTLDALYDHAAKRAFRFHPDSTSLTAFESKAMRRVFPFYTWFKGTLPALIESGLSNPGRVAVFHKASFNIAQAQGIDAESYANPWPEDADVPEFLRGRLFGANFKAPDGSLFSMNPGLPHQDLMSDFFGQGMEKEKGIFWEDTEYKSTPEALMSNALKWVANFSSPVARAPFELMSGTTLAGKEIQSTGDYIDSSTPFINYISNFLGYSVAGSAGSLLSSGKLTPQRSVELGYKDPIAYPDDAAPEKSNETQVNTMLNWLFGQGATRVNKLSEADARKDRAKERQTYWENYLGTTKEEE